MPKPQQNMDTEQLSIAIFSDIEKVAILTYESENKRDDLIRSQASRLQAAYSFVMAAIGTAIPSILTYRSTLPLEYLLVVFSTVYILLFAGLFCSTLVHLVQDYESFQNITDFKEFYNKNLSNLLKKSQRSDHFTNLLDIIQSSRRKKSEKKVKYLKIALFLFLFSLCLCFIWFIISVILLLAWR